MNALSLNTSVLLRISHAGIGAILVDTTGTQFELSIQRKLWALADAIMELRGDGVLEVVPGVNNLLVVFDPCKLTPANTQQLILAWWNKVDISEGQGREIEIPVIYGGVAGEDLLWLAEAAGLDIERWV